MNQSGNYIEFSNEGVNVRVGVYIFKNKGVFIAYCPSLDLSGYDLSEEQAKKDFEFMLTDWLKTQLKNHTLNEDLQKHGWRVKDKFAREPDVVDLITKRVGLKDIVEMPEYVKTNLAANIKQSDYGYIQA